jgi:hypothetical protein
MIPILYASTDAGSPVLDGLAGSALTVLRACLVSGYGIKPAAGWTEPFASAGNIAVFRNTDLECARITDAASGTVAGRECRVRAYKSMTDLNTGLEETPSAAQCASGIIWIKSQAATSTARPWLVFATSTWFYLFTDVGNGAWNLHFAGRTVSRAPGDAHPFGVIGGQFPDATTSSHFGAKWDGAALGTAPIAATSLSAGGNAIGYLMRAGAAGPGAVLMKLSRANAVSSSERLGASGVAYPDVVSGGGIFSRATISDGANRLRGYLPGVWAPNHNAPFANNAIVSGPSSASMRALNCTSEYVLWNASFSQICIDLTSDA